MGRGNGNDHSGIKMAITVGQLGVSIIRGTKEDPSFVSG